MTLVKRVVCEGDPAEHQHFLRRMHQSGKHLLHVVNDLLDFSKLEAGKMKLHAAPLDVQSIVDEVRETMIGLSKEKDLTIVYPALESPITLVADSVKLAQIFINLVGNAIKFSPAGSQITIAAKLDTVEDKPSIVFSVSDQGMGIPKNQTETIFESFRQVDGGHTRMHGGTGLGLAITRQLVQLHGGKISCESEVGKGSTFTFYMPLAGLSTKDSQWGGDPNQPGAQPRRVLVIDDNQIQLEIIAMILDREGLTAELISDAHLGFSKAKSSQPDFIILDVMMPEVSGISILRQLASDPQTRAIPVLVATAYHSNRELVREMGAIWLPKPWGAPELREALKRNLGIELEGTPHSAESASNASEEAALGATVKKV